MAVNGSYSTPTRPGLSAGSSVDAFKKSFFDATPVIKAMDRATQRAFSKFGAFVRRRAQTSIRYRVKPSEPGKPPSAHKTAMRKKTNRRTGESKVQDVSPLREFLFFACDRDSKTVVIGPAKTNQRNAYGDRPIPDILEHGGSVQLLEHLHTFRGGRQVWLRTDLRFRLSGKMMQSAVGKPRRIRTVAIAARPYMEPAFQAELPKLPGMYANAF